MRRPDGAKLRFIRCRARRHIPKLEAGVDLIRVEESSNTSHFYRMELMPGLFGDWSLVREWGRTGQPGQIRVDWFDDETEAKGARFAIQMEKAKKGYE